MNVGDKQFKKVSFSEKLVVHQICCWSFAYRKARISKWEEVGRDRVRFQRRIESIEKIISPVLLKFIRDRGMDKR